MLSSLLHGPVLGDISNDRNNNYNLLRFLAAAGVIVSHSYPIIYGLGSEEPLDATLGFSLGRLSVYIFFVISGFLIAQSYERQKNLLKYAIARILRIFPALLIVTTLSAFLLGPLVTNIPPSAYFSQPEVVLYIIRNTTLASLQFDIPGVFETNAYPSAINGSLWTLPYEVACYVAVAIVGLFGMFRSKMIYLCVIVSFIAAWLLYDYYGATTGIWYKLGLFFELGSYFLIGTSAYIFRQHIKINAATILIPTILAILLFDTIAFTPIFMVALTMAIFMFVYIPGGFIRRYNELGDYSYGLYIFAFPVQQSLYYMNPDISLYQMIGLAFVVTLAFSVVSWHIVEKPSLGLKANVVGLLKRVPQKT